MTDTPNWEQESTTVTHSTWTRSYEQTISTRLGTDFTLTAKMERISAVIDADGNATLLPELRQELPQLDVTFQAAIADPVLAPLAATLQGALTQILQILRQRQLGQ